MGAICPCSREAPRSPKLPASDLSSAQFTDSEITVCTASSFSVELKAEESVIRLVGSLDRYYELGIELSAEGDARRYRAVFLATEQPCSVEIVPKNLIRNKAKTKANLLGKLARLNHPHILRVLEVLQDANNLYLAAELQGESLESYINAHGPLTERQAASVMTQVMKALAFAHSAGVVHQRVSGRSVVLSAPRDMRTLRVKLADFHHSDLKIDCKINDDHFFPPETILGDYTDKSDIWSCGLLLVYLLTGVKPLPRGLSLSHPVFESHIWSKLSADAGELVVAMLRRKPENRPSALEVMKYQWMKRFQTQGVVTDKSIRDAVAQLRNWKPCNILQEAIVRFSIARVLPLSVLLPLADAFDALDVDCDGRISKAEFLRTLRVLFPEEKAQEYARRILANTDRDGSGSIEYSEFLLCSLNAEQVCDEETLSRVFRSLDADSSGAISIAELKRFFRLAHTREEKDWIQLVAKYDESGDGEIDYAEFLRLMSTEEKESN